LVKAALIAGPSSDVPPGTSQVSPTTEVKADARRKAILAKEIDAIFYLVSELSLVNQHFVMTLQSPLYKNIGDPGALYEEAWPRSLEENYLSALANGQDISKVVSIPAVEVFSASSEGCVMAVLKVLIN
jgi:hypothetical protein